jgi:hypothetical protein
METGQHAVGLETLALAQHHDLAEHDTREQATGELAKWQPLVDSDLFSAAVGRGKEADLETALRSTSQMLSSPDVS